MLVEKSRHQDFSKQASIRSKQQCERGIWGGGRVGGEGAWRTISHVLDGIVVQHLASIPRVAALCQQVSQGFIVYLNEGGLHGVLPPRVSQLAGCLQDLLGRNKFPL